MFLRLLLYQKRTQLVDDIAIAIFLKAGIRHNQIIDNKRRREINRFVFRQETTMNETHCHPLAITGFIFV